MNTCLYDVPRSLTNVFNNLRTYDLFSKNVYII